MVITDNIRLTQVIMNLVSNSLKYTNFGTIDTLIESYENKKICKGKKMIKISVSDTGMGMSKE